MQLTDKISAFCTYGEAIHSQIAERLGIDNTPSIEQLEAMKYVASEIFDKIRTRFGRMSPSSFFRCAALNAVVAGASSTSQHMKGEAIDHYLIGRNAEIFKWAKANTKILNFDQMIWEFGTKDEPAWVHISKVKNGVNRQQILRAFVDENKRIQYINFDLF